jgi:hypothetical protein
MAIWRLRVSLTLRSGHRKVTELLSAAGARHILVQRLTPESVVRRCPTCSKRAPKRAARAAGQPLMKGGDVTEGREKLRSMLRTTLGDEPVFQVSRRAEWTLRALSGGYARESDKSDAMAGPYRLIGESLESFAAFAGSPEDEGIQNRLSSSGRPYFSSVVTVPRRREREPA